MQVAAVVERITLAELRVQVEQAVAVMPAILGRVMLELQIWAVAVAVLVLLQPMAATAEAVLSF
jgi:hypothetical protein